MKLLNFSKANCKNCYKCLRTCQVKAVKIQNDQADIVEERCIGCGQCLVVCPQDARNIKSDLADVKVAIKQNRRVIASIAPSFAGAFDMITEGHFVAALKSLGFSVVEETAVGAEIVAQLYDKAVKNNKQKNLFTTSCPSANYLIDTYYPSLTKYLIPVVSPMLAHGKTLKQNYGHDSFVVFIGPCTAKKIEAVSFQHEGTIDAVLTFEELSRWMQEEELDMNSLQPQKFEAAACMHGQAYPLIGGVLNSFDDSVHYEKLRVDGIAECMEALKSIEDGNLADVCVEFNVCTGGCINGPGMPKHEKDFYKSQKRVKKYISSKKNSLSLKRAIPEKLDFSKVFIPRPIEKHIASDTELMEILESIGKYEPSDELNCGGCGYNTCREKAQAVFEGMAEMSMCLPYMRGKAENITNVIYENTPNLIMFIDDKLNVKEINPIAQKIFGVAESFIKDRPISIIMDEEPFKMVRDSKKSLLAQRVYYQNYGVVLLQNILYVEKQNVILAIMSNITNEEKQRDELKRVKENAIDAAEKVIEKQMRVAQEIASLLGETTAETKITLTKLKKLHFKKRVSDMSYFIDVGFDSVNKYGEELCGDKVEIIKDEGGMIIVLADGLGSGVKANILATLTSKIAGTMLREGASIDETVDTIVKTLPVCNTRKLAYSTFTILKICCDGRIYAVEYDNPPLILVKDNRLSEVEKTQIVMNGRNIQESNFCLQEGDSLTIISDGIVHAGVGATLNLGWQWNNVADYIMKLSKVEKCARNISKGLIDACQNLYDYKPGDDATVVTIKLRKPETIDLFTGPPTINEVDSVTVKKLMAGCGKKIVCGGTAANIVARELGQDLHVSMEFPDPEIPPVGYIKGIDLVTEGVLTICKTIEKIKSFIFSQSLYTVYKFDNLDGASQLTKLLIEDCTHLNLWVGSAVNPAHQKPDFPSHLSIKAKLVEELALLMKQLGKEVNLTYI